MTVAVAVPVRATSAGEPWATIRPPASPPSGPSSTTWSARGDDHRVVLDDHQGVAARDQLIEHPQELRHVRQVEPGRRLVEHVERGLVPRGRGELGGQLQPLRLAAGQGVTSLPELQIAHAELGEAAQRAGHPRERGEGLERPRPP